MYLGGEIAAPPALVRMRLCSSEYFCNYFSEPLDILLRPSWVLVFRVLPFAHVGNVCNQCCWSDVGTSQCSQCGAREFCWFGFSNFPKVILMCFLQRIWGWNESHCSTEIVSLEQSSIGMWVLETAMGNVFACTRHSIWTNQYWAFYRGSGRGEELIGLGLQNVDFKIRPVITCLKNIFSHKASVDLTEMSWKKCEVFFVFSHAMYLFVKLCNKHVLSLFSRLDIWHHTKIRLFFLHSWIVIHGGNNIFTYTTLYSKETTKRKIYRRSTSIEQIPEDFFTELFCFHVSIVLIEPTTFSCT